LNISSTSTNLDFSRSHKDHGTKEVSKIIENQPKKSSNPTTVDLNSFVNDLNNNPVLNRKLKFGFNKVSDIFYITMIDAQTDKVLKEYSKDEALNLAKKLDELSGIIFDQSA
jgi:flagellar protein FlaG